MGGGLGNNLPNRGSLNAIFGRTERPILLRLQSEKPNQDSSGLIKTTVLIMPWSKWHFNDPPTPIMIRIMIGVGVPHDPD